MKIDFVIDIPPSIKSFSQIVQYVDGVLSNINTQESQSAPTPLSHYQELEWDVPKVADTNDVTSFGTKMLPGAGPFYFANHEDGSSEIGHIDRRDD